MKKLISIMVLIAGIILFGLVKLLFPFKDSSGMPLIIPNYAMFLFVLSIILILVGLIFLIIRLIKP